MAAFYYGLTTWHLELNMGWNILFLLVIHGGVFSIMYFLERRYCSGNASLRITGKELAVAGTITLAVYAISNMSYALSASPFSSQFPGGNFHHPHPWRTWAAWGCFSPITCNCK